MRQSVATVVGSAIELMELKLPNSARLVDRPVLLEVHAVSLSVLPAVCLSECVSEC